MIKFNNKALPEWVSVTGVSFESLNLSILEHEAKRRVGNIDAGIDVGGISIVLSIFIEATKDLSILEQADELKRFMMGDKWNVSRLILLEQPSRFYYARVSNAGETIDAFTHGETTITFHCSDPKKYSIYESAHSSTAGAYLATYTDMEKVPVDVKVDITKAVTNLQVKHKESGRTVTVLGDFKVGQSVIIDSSMRNILIDQNRAKEKMAFESEWLYLMPGSNTFTCTSPNSIKNDFTIKYRAAN